MSFLFRDIPGIQLRRAATLARRLVEEGLSPAVLTVGILPDHGATVRFILRLRQDSLPSPESSGDAG